MRFLFFVRQEWIERMDDEEGEEDEESTQLQIWNPEAHGLSLTLLSLQDELFHTGEECIDRVAEASQSSFFDSTFFLPSCLDFSDFCWIFPLFTNFVVQSRRQRTWRPLAKASSDSLVTSHSRQCEKNGWPLLKWPVFHTEMTQIPPLPFIRDYYVPFIAGRLL